MSLAAFLAHSGRPRSLDEIRVAIPEYKPGEAGRQMFIRDKRELVAAGFEVTEGDDRYIIPRDRLYLPDLFLEDAERAALLVALLSVRESRGSLRTVGATVGGFGDLSDVRKGRAPAVQADLNAAACVDVLHRAISERRRVTGSYGGKERTLEPLGLLSRRGHWYLHARDLADGERKNFRVERFGSGPDMVGPSGAFAHPADLDLTAVLQDAWNLPSDVRYEVVVEVDDTMAGRAAFEVADDAELTWLADGSLRLTMVVTHLDAFRSWLLSYRDHAVVVGPPEVRQHIRSWLTGMVQGSVG